MAIVYYPFTLATYTIYFTAPARASRAGAVGFEGIQAAAAWWRLRERDLAARVLRS
jgi:hypothetical protein